MQVARYTPAAPSLTQWTATAPDVMGLAGIIVVGPVDHDLGFSGVLRMQDVAGRTAAEQHADDIMQMLDRRNSNQ